MNTAEIVVREVQSDSGLQMRELLAESICQPRQTAKLHSHREVLPFHVRRADVIGVRVALSDFGYNLRDWAWGVPFIPELAVVSKEFRQLSIVNVRAKTFFNGLAIENEGVGSELDSIPCAPEEIANKGLSVFARTLPNKKRRDEFSVCIQRNKNPLISKIKLAKDLACSGNALNKSNLPTHARSFGTEESV